MLILMFLLLVSLLNHYLTLKYILLSTEFDVSYRNIFEDTISLSSVFHFIILQRSLPFSIGKVVIRNK